MERFHQHDFERSFSDEANIKKPAHKIAAAVLKAFVSSLILTLVSVSNTNVLLRLPYWDANFFTSSRSDLFSFYYGATSMFALLFAGERFGVRMSETD